MNVEPATSVQGVLAGTTLYVDDAVVRVVALVRDARGNVHTLPASVQVRVVPNSVLRAQRDGNTPA